MGLFKDKNRNIKYREYTGITDNPYIGYAPDTDSVSLCKDSNLVYLMLLWSELEPDEGDYRWEAVEQNHHLKEYREAGKHLVLRFVCDYPTQEEHMDIPKWLYDKTGDGEFYDFEYGKGYCPNYDNETFMKEHSKVIAEIGRYFSQDDFLCYVELGSLGHWGEWHTYYPAGIPKMPLTSVRAKYVEDYERSFPNAKLMMRRPFAELPKGWGVFNDMVGANQDTYEWLDWIEKGGDYDSTGEKGAIKARPGIWNEAPIGGEFTSSIAMSDLLGRELDETISMIDDSHMTFIGPKIPDYIEEPKLKEAAQEVLSHVGYRYRISELDLTHKIFGHEMAMSVTLTNDGNAPIYYKRIACLYFEFPEGVNMAAYEPYADGYGMPETDTENMLRFEMDLDLRKLEPGEEEEFFMVLPRELFEISGMRVYAGIENPETGENDIRFSMDEPLKGNLSLLW